jgi:exopolysaccharide biosynthesis predicted pyruvyltransferase EpsI
MVITDFLFGFFLATFLMSMIQCIFILNSMKKTCTRMIKNINGMKRTLKNY